MAKKSEGWVNWDDEFVNELKTTASACKVFMFLPIFGPSKSFVYYRCYVFSNSRLSFPPSTLPSLLGGKQRWRTTVSERSRPTRLRLWCQTEFRTSTYCRSLPFQHSWPSLIDLSISLPSTFSFCLCQSDWELQRSLHRRRCSPPQLCHLPLPPIQGHQPRLHHSMHDRFVLFLLFAFLASRFPWLTSSSIG
jgi:hypothetical protein